MYQTCYQFAILLLIYARTMSKELVDAIKGMIANFHNYMMRARMATSAAAAGGVPVGAPPNTAPPPPVGATKLNMPPPQSAAPMSSLPERMPEGAVSALYYIGVSYV